MGILTRVNNLVRQYGLKAVLTKIAGQAFDRFYEWRTGIDTISIRKLETLTVSSGSKELGNYYEGSRVMPLRCLIPIMRSMVAADSAFVDCGCGKGKVLLIAAECGVHQVRGVEFAHELCDIARTNWQKVYRPDDQSHHCEIVCSDILQYDIRDNDSMFFLFNPFDPIILKGLLEKILQSHRDCPRKIVVAVAFLGSEYADVFLEFPALIRKTDVIYWACSFSLFTVE